MGGTVRLLLGGDVMTGRGIDQLLARPVRPRLTERHVVDARDYVALAERRSGPIPRPVPPEYPWGDVLELIAEVPTAVRLMNLETSVTHSEERERHKTVLYRMSPDNLAVLEVAGVDVWGLANNHVLDHGRTGLLDTVDALGSAGLTTAGAGATEAAAWAPAAVAVQGGAHRVVTLCIAHPSSGVPRHWRARPSRPGVALVEGLGRSAADRVTDRLAATSGAGDVRVVSIHWGTNWGHDVPEEQRTFARRLLAGGVHVVVGHSSHHPRPVEVVDGGLVLYGCGDLVNDYEGIRGYEQFRGELRVVYLAALDATTGHLLDLEIVPFRSRRLRLERADVNDTRWLAGTLAAACRAHGTRVEPAGDRLRVPGE
ncbi:CapA family protein [Intrasporangium sp. DVR]|uniref:CapA family protein n=1 Tax=Intrasporangium sp. DVR TaxID=3127867 RepID=UPI00313A5028